MRDRIWRWSFVAALTVIGAGLWHAQIRPALAQGGVGGADCSSCVAVIDVDGVLRQLQERGDRLNDLRALDTQLVAQLQEHVAKVKQLDNELQVLPPSSPEYAETRLKLQEAMVVAEFQEKAAQGRLATREKDIMVVMFNKIAEATARYAAREGIDVVLANDQSIELSTEQSMAQVQTILGTRKLIYAENQLDITDDVVTMMNNEYRAAQP